MPDQQKTPPFVPPIPEDAKRAAPHPPPADLTKPPAEPKPSIPVPDNGKTPTIDAQQYAATQPVPDNGQPSPTTDAQQQRLPYPPLLEQALEPQPMEAMFYQMRDDQKKLEHTMLIFAVGVLGGALIILYVYKKNVGLTPDFDAMRGVE